VSTAALQAAAQVVARLRQAGVRRIDEVRAFLTRRGRRCSLSIVRDRNAPRRRTLLTPL
jgi:hypothetical protein